MAGFTGDAACCATMEKLKLYGYVAILRTQKAESVAPAVDAYLAGGLRVIEITTTCPEWLSWIQKLCARRDGGEPDLMVGAGTVLTVEQARAAVAAGAQFLVSPVLDEEVVAEAIQNLKTVMIPGCNTPSEMWRAYKLGCQAQKLYPEPHGAALWIKRVKGALPMLNIVPSNATTDKNAAAYLSAGAACIGAGNSFLMPAADVEAGAWDTVRARAAAMVTAVRNWQSANEES